MSSSRWSRKCQDLAFCHQQFEGIPSNFSSVFWHLWSYLHQLERIFNCLSEKYIQSHVWSIAVAKGVHKVGLTFWGICCTAGGTLFESIKKDDSFHWYKRYSSCHKQFLIHFDFHGPLQIDVVSLLAIFFSLLLRQLEAWRLLSAFCTEDLQLSIILVREGE